MSKRATRAVPVPAPGLPPFGEFYALSRRILRDANLELPRDEFARAVLSEVLEFSGCDFVELRVNEGQRHYRARLDRAGEFLFAIQSRPEPAAQLPTEPDDDPQLAKLCADITSRRSDRSILYHEQDPEHRTGRCVPDFCSLALIPFAAGDDGRGLLLLCSRQPEHFRRSEMEPYEGVGQMLGVALADRRARVALRERIKELTCLYGIAKIVEEPGHTPDSALELIVVLLPAAWLHSDIASARIELDGRQHSTASFRDGPHQQQSVVTVRGRARGLVEVVYAEPRPFLDEGPFLFEERKLIDAVAREVALFVERHEAARETAQLGEQLRHADRLATIGQLAAGVAHEVNEPLGNILGFAQLAQKAANLPTQAASDIERVVRAALHAREIVSKLMLFARQKPATKTRVDLNGLIEEGLYILDARCTKAGIELVRELSPSLPKLKADASQLTQVLVNLVVNSIQAMPEGGRLTVRTASRGRSVVLTVEDTGIGMTKETLEQVFVPFYTTKPVGEGTGLGLSVVHGIVTGHGGSVDVKSEPGCGTRFEVALPVDGREGADGDAG